ncbi:MAG: hypothetical protein V4722_18100 [Bacteroidota bacterium]
MKPVISILFLLLSSQLFAIKIPPRIFIDNYWKDFEYYRHKQRREKFQSVFFPDLPEVLIYGSENSLLKRKLLFHEIGVPRFFTPHNNEGTDISQYLKFIIFAKENPKKIFPDIIRRPISYVPNFITESFYRFGITVPFN